MALINARLLFFPLLLLFLAGTVSAQSGGLSVRSGLETEIGNLERSLLGLSVLAERREAYIKLARLYMLSGNLDISARAWREAGRADPENRDDRCFLESALCFLQLGEFDAASDALRGILEGDRDTAIFRDAQYISAQIEVFRTGNSGALYALLEKAEFQDYRPAIYYTFWRIFADEAYKTQILSEFPHSPEAGILQSEEASAAAGSGTTAKVSALNRPLWFFYPGRSSVSIGAAVPTTALQYQGPAATTAAASPGRPQAGPSALQTGLFNRQENARAMVSRLASKGFTAEVSPKLVNGVTYWTVSVPPGENSNQTILALKDAGFESFPVF
ncbi:hypothetical protein FACS1894137_13460 [Spirochaetia bacterium]|nr:hypothetical protein FACS1894137_13460 [Spirochaetia bacterium]